MQRESILSPLRPVYYDGTDCIKRAGAVSPGVYRDAFWIDFEDGDRVEINGDELQRVNAEIDDLVIWNMRSGTIPADISSSDFRALCMLAWIYHVKLEQNGGKN